MSDACKRIRWQISVPIFMKSIILKQLGIAIGIPFGVVSLFIVITSDESSDMLYALGLIVALLIITFLYIMIVYRGKYEAEFILDEKGALCQTQAKQAKKNSVLNTLTIVMSILSGIPAGAGAGMLAQSRQKTFIRWSHVTKVKYKPKSNTILIRGDLMENIALFCTSENYQSVEGFVRAYSKKN